MCEGKEGVFLSRGAMVGNWGSCHRGLLAAEANVPASCPRDKSWGVHLPTLVTPPLPPTPASATTAGLPGLGATVHGPRASVAAVVT